MGFLVRLLAYAAGLAAASWLLVDISFNGPENGTPELQEKVLPLLGVALVLTLVNTIIRPVVKVLTFPITILTLGMFLLVVNGLMLLLANRITDVFDLGFRVNGIWAAVIGALVITVVGWHVDAAVGNE
jgi:putative membrane protein